MNIRAKLEKDVSIDSNLRVYAFDESLINSFFVVSVFCQYKDSINDKSSIDEKDKVLFSEFLINKVWGIAKVGNLASVIVNLVDVPVVSIFVLYNSNSYWAPILSSNINVSVIVNIWPD